MGRSWSRRLFFIFIFLNLVIAVLAVGGFCAATEIDATGELQYDIEREFAHSDTGTIKQQLESLEYRFTTNSGTYSAPMRGFVEIMMPLMGALCIAELILLMFQGGAGRRSANRLLKPISQITRTAQRLSTSNLEEARFENLEHAIENLNPDKGARLRTGEREMKGLETAINDLILRTHESYKEQMRFVSDASHELRTPIAVIQGYSSMLDRWGKTDEKILDESIAAIMAESEHMNRLVEQLLFLARGDSGRTELQMEQFSLSNMLHEVFDEYQMIDKLHEYEYQSSIDAMCVADPSMIKQVARILTDNAIKYTPEGGKIVLKVMDGDIPGFQVQDSGIGIGEGDLPHIFERFFRSDPSRDRATGGTGLGLSIAKWIVDRHNGYFEVLSRDGIGTRIAVFLPIPKPEKNQ